MLQPILGDISTSDTSIDRVRDEWISKGGHEFSLAILILTSVNVLAAFLTIASIFYEAWSTKEWDFYPKTRKFFTFVPTVHPAHVFPIIFLTAVIIQGAILIGISVGESRNILHGCRMIAQVVWPVLWIAPYITLMFGLETALRSLQHDRFGIQGRWHIIICVSGALILTLLTWIPSKVSPSNGQCLSSIIWWTAHYAKAGFAIALTLVVAYTMCASVITIQLLKTVKMDRDQRIQASTVVYYLIVTTFIMSMIIPYYTQVIMLGRAIRVSKMAEVVLSTTGIIPAILRMLLWSNADWTMVQASQNYRIKKRPLTVGTTDLDIYDQMTSPVSLHTCNSHTLLNDPEKFAMKSLEPGTETASEPQIHHKGHVHEIQSQNIDTALTIPSIQIEPSQLVNQNRAHYSIFPTLASEMARESTSTTFSQGDDVIELPKPLFAFGHKRDLSEQSSATVQIGLRLSNLPHPSDSIESFTTPKFLRSVDSLYGSPQAAKKTFRHTSSPKSPLSEIAILPTYPNQARTPSQSMSPGAELLSPTWLLRNNSQVNYKHRRREKDTMKSLPPTPPRDVASSLSVQRSPNLLRLTSRHDVPTAEKWI